MKAELPFFWCLPVTQMKDSPCPCRNPVTQFIMHEGIGSVFVKLFLPLQHQRFSYKKPEFYPKVTGKGLRVTGKFTGALVTQYNC